MAISRLTVRTIVGVIGNFLSGGLFLSPVPTMYRIYKNKDAEEFSPMPYIATVMNCMLWIFYGLPINHPNSTLVITINGAGLVLELIYLSLFLLYGRGGHRKKIGFFGLAELVAMSVIIGVDLSKFHTHDSRSKFVGSFCVVFGIVMYAAPLTVMLKVIKTRSVEYMPFLLSLTSFLNGVCWTTYALLQFDWFILIANGSGALLGACQLILYGIYYRSTPKKGQDDVKPSEVQMA